MADKTIVVFLSSASGKTTLTLRLYAGATLINTGGDTLTESGTSGRFACVVTEAVSAGWHRTDVFDGSELAYEGGWVYLPGDTEGEYLVDDPAAGGESAADVYSYFTDGTRANAFKATGFAVAGDAMALTSGERSTLAGVIDSTLLDAGDATDLIASIVTRIGNTNVDQTAFVAAVKAALFDSGSAANKLAVDASGRVTIGTNEDKSGYALTATTGLGNQTANITGNLSGSVGSVTSGVTVATNNDKTGYALSTAPLDAAGIRTAVGLTSANLNTQLSGIVARLWTTAELAQMRYRIGIDGTATEPTTNESNLSVTIRPSVVINANVPTVDEGLEFSVTQRDDFENDSEIGPIGPIRIETTLPLLREIDPPRLRFGATLRSTRQIPIYAIGTAYAQSVIGQANQYDVFLEITSAELNKPPGLYGWDVEAVFSDGDVRTLVGGLMTITPSMGDNETRDPLNPT